MSPVVWFRSWPQPERRAAAVFLIMIAVSLAFWAADALEVLR